MGQAKGGWRGPVLGHKVAESVAKSDQASEQAAESFTCYAKEYVKHKLCTYQRRCSMDWVSGRAINFDTRAEETSFGGCLVFMSRGGTPKTVGLESM